MTSTTPPTPAAANRQRLPAALRPATPSQARQPAQYDLRRAGTVNRGGTQAVEAENGFLAGNVNRKERFRAAQIVALAGAATMCKGGPSLQPGVFRLGLLEDWDVGVGVFPQSKEILIDGLGFGFIARQSVGSA
jgi:hypothetical protein